MRREELVPVQIYEPVRKIIRDWPVAARRELGATLLRLQRGELIGMPDVRAMPSVAKGVSEIRISLAGDAYRAFYISVTEEGILVFHAFIKKTQQTPQKEINTALKRLHTFFRNIKG
ncbi:MAG: type II toxin-antitoxin system RelE/ParE family toxin [Proteobacteria bacterium]|jgi:phage-related protein|nr:type II toxin-antitoxin system RelE/ParE family toxin [Pseudomonadota bacterium]